jgi:hypothetical protein
MIQSTWSMIGEATGGAPPSAEPHDEPGSDDTAEHDHDDLVPG